MALETDEIKKINDLYKELDQKELKIQSIDNNLVTAQNTVNFLNQSIENYKEVISELSGKLDTVIAKRDSILEENDGIGGQGWYATPHASKYGGEIMIITGLDNQAFCLNPFRKIN